jgi:ribosomal-protein-alanine N-acetyltransferase
MTPAEMAQIHAASFSQPRPWSETEFADLIAAPNCNVLTADQGFAIIRIAGPEAELLTIAVAPAARRSGIARHLLARAIDHAKVQNCEDMFLEVVANNQPAIALYTTSGFNQLAIRKDYYNGPKGAKSSALVMRRAF